MMLQVKTRAKLLLSFTCNFHYSYLLRIVVIFFHFHYSHTTLHSTNDGLRKSRCVITGRCFNLFTSNAYWFCMAVFHAFSAPNVMEFVCLYEVVAFSPFLDEGKEQRLVESCVFPQKCNGFFPSIVSNLRITTGARPVIRVHHRSMHTLVRTAILRLRCLHACIFRLKSAGFFFIRLCLLRLWA